MRRGRERYRGAYVLARLVDGVDDLDAAAVVRGLGEVEDAARDVASDGVLGHDG